MSFQISNVEEHQLTASDEIALNQLLCSAFGDEFGDRSYFQQRHHIRVIARQDDQIIGQMSLCYRSIRLGADLVPIMGLGDVATAPEQRGRGVAGAMLTTAIDIVSQSAAQFFVLFGDRPIYAGHGFVAASNTVTYSSLENAHTGAVTTKSDANLMVLPLTDRVWDAVAPVDLLGFSF